MDQNRDAPAFQEYAAAMLSRLTFRTMSLQERGLLYTMRLECWVNMRLPSDQINLAKVLGLPIAEVAAALPTVMPFFKVANDFIISPELEDYRHYLEMRKYRQSQGGKRGAATTNSKLNRPTKATDTVNSTTTSSNPRQPHQGRNGSSAQNRTAQDNQNQSSKKWINDSFVEEYQKCESTENDYRKKSRGD